MTYVDFLRTPEPSRLGSAISAHSAARALGSALAALRDRTENLEILLRYALGLDLVERIAIKGDANSGLKSARSDVLSAPKFRL